MHRYTFCETAEAADLEPVVLAIHEIIHRLPVTAKSLRRPGIRIEDGRVIDRNYTGPGTRTGNRDEHGDKNNAGTGCL